MKTYIQWIVYFKKERYGELGEGGEGSWHKLYSMRLPVKHTWFFVLHLCKIRKSHIAKYRNWSVSKVRKISFNMFQWCMSSHWAHLPCTDKSLSTCSNDVCPLIELPYPAQINLSQHVPMMYVLYMYINSSCVFLKSNRKSQTTNIASQLFIFLVHISKCCFYISYSYLEIEFITENHIW